jgi:hypothetical protein
MYGFNSVPHLYQPFGWIRRGYCNNDNDNDTMLTTYLGNKVPLAVQIAQHASSILQSRLASWIPPKKLPDTSLAWGVWSRRPHPSPGLVLHLIHTWTMPVTTSWLASRSYSYPSMTSTCSCPSMTSTCSCPSMTSTCSYGHPFKKILCQNVHCSSYHKWHKWLTLCTYTQKLGNVRYGIEWKNGRKMKFMGVYAGHSSEWGICPLLAVNCYKCWRSLSGELR